MNEAITDLMMSDPTIFLVGFILTILLSIVLVCLSIAGGILLAKLLGF